VIVNSNTSHVAFQNIRQLEQVQQIRAVVQICLLAIVNNTVPAQGYKFFPNFLATDFLFFCRHCAMGNGQISSL